MRVIERHVWQRKWIPHPHNRQERSSSLQCGSCIVGDSAVKRRNDAGCLYLGGQFSLTTAPCWHFKTIKQLQLKINRGRKGVGRKRGAQNFSYRHKNTVWEHAGCDGTPKRVAVPGVAACLCVAWCAWLFQPAQRQEVCRLSRENTRLLIKNFNAFTSTTSTTSPSFLSPSWFFASRKGPDPCQRRWAHSDTERNKSTSFQMHVSFTWRCTCTLHSGGAADQSEALCSHTGNEYLSVRFYQKYNKEGRSLFCHPTHFWYPGQFL